MKKKILLIESEMALPAGHFLDYLFEISNYFKDNKKHNAMYKTRTY